MMPSEQQRKLAALREEHESVARYVRQVEAQRREAKAECDRLTQEIFRAERRLAELQTEGLRVQGLRH